MMYVILVLCHRHCKIHFFQTFWDDVRAEMIQEKGIDPIAVDKIGKYVELKGTINVLFLFTLFKCDTEIFLKIKKRCPITL